jgi:mono/diheme cytochrome c family protein
MAGSGKESLDTVASCVQRHAASAVLATTLLFGASDLAGEHQQGSGPVSVTSPAQLFQTNCGACHSLDLPRSQRLDRKTWRWVVDDMVNQFGATWITEDQQEIIVDYLAENYGPDRPRKPAAEQ